MTDVTAAVPAWPHDNTAAKNAFYGDFHQPDWPAKYLTRITPPFQMYYAKKPIASIMVNKMCAVDLLAVFNQILSACDHDQHKVDATGASDFGGCFNIRPIVGSRGSWSNHSWACAIDLSPASNGFNMKGTISNIVVDAFKSHGWRWGGNYVGRKDDMHFEAVRP
jgi:D-alanyl-D-alanine carboxypeptidase-like protein